MKPMPDAVRRKNFRRKHRKALKNKRQLKKMLRALDRA